MIVFSAREWQGEYWSRDVPGGVEIVPYESAVFIVPADGGAAPRRVVDVEGRGDFPNWSPDGEWIYFQAAPGGSSGVFRCREDGSELLNLTASHVPPGDRYGYRSSRDGTRMLFVFHDGRIGRVGIMEPDGSHPTLIAPDIGYHYMADISPDNRSVVFAHTARGYILTLKRLDSPELKVLTPDLPECFCPQFTPDGRTILFTRRDGDIYRVNTDGTGFTRLTHGNDYCSFYLSPRDSHGSSDPPSLSPDGRQVAYIAKRDGVPQLHVMSIDGSGQRQITRRRTPCGRASFSADGARIAFVSWEEGRAQAFVVPSGGGEPRRLTSVRGAVCSLSWRPARA